VADDIVKEALEAFEIVQDAETDNRKHAEDDIEFARLSCQWPDWAKNQRTLEQRPCLTFNKLGPVIRQVINDSRMNRPATSVHPVDGHADKDTAEVLTGLIRNIEASSDADIAYDTAVENAVSGGFGYWKINTEYALNAIDEDGIRSMGESAFDQNLFIRAVPNIFSIYGDPYSQAADSSDWMSAFEVEQITKKQFQDRFKGAEMVDFSAAEWTEVREPWVIDETVQIAAFWKREKVVKQAYAVQLPGSEEMPGDVVVMFEDELKKEPALLQSGAQVIGQPRPVASFKVTQHMLSGAEELGKIDWPGAYIPIVPVYGDEVNLKGKRHFRSLIRDAREPQMKYNFWSTTATEMVALAPKVPFIGEEGAFDVGNEKWQTANSQSHSYLEHKKGTQPPQRQPFSGVPAGVIQEALNASDEIKAITGIYDASLGARSNETSGVAIRNRQMEGDVATFHFIDNLTRAIRHSGRIMVDLIPKVYSTPRIVRILGEDGSTEERKLNQPYENDGVMRLHDVRTGRYDVTVKAGPGFTTRREEAAAQMMDLIKAFGPETAKLFGDLLAKNLDWPGADEIAERLKKLLPPELRDEQGGLPPEVEAQMKQMAQAIQQLQAALQEAQQNNDMESRKIAVDEYKAVTERFDKMGMDPAQAPALLMGLAQDIAATETAMAPAAQNFPQEGAAPIGQAA
jgi:hypothetical protein